MSDWIAQYGAALAERDAREQAHKPYIEAYTKLAHRTASLEARAPAAAEASSPSTPDPSKASTKDRPSTPSKARPGTPKEAAESPAGLVARLRADLAAANKARAGLQDRLNALTAALSAEQTQQRTSTSQVAQLTRHKAELVRKLRDRDEELKGKSELVEKAHDEMVALGLQLNMAEAKSDRLRQENEELVERWMKRMGEEVERVNRDSKWT